MHPSGVFRPLTPTPLPQRLGERGRGEGAICPAGVPGERTSTESSCWVTSYSSPLALQGEGRGTLDDKPLRGGCSEEKREEMDAVRGNEAQRGGFFQANRSFPSEFRGKAEAG